MRRAQPLGRGHAPGAAARAVPRLDARAVARGGLRVRRGDEARRAGPDAAAVQEPRQRGRFRVRARALPAAAGRRRRRIRPHRDLRDAADRRRRTRRRRALGRQGPRQGRRAALELRARHRHQGPCDRPRGGLLGAPDGRRDPRVRPREGPRAAGVGARREGGVEGPQAARPPDPHARPVAAQGRAQVRPDRRHVALPDDERRGRTPRLDRVRRRARVRRRDDLGARPAADVQDALLRAQDPRGRRTDRVGREGAARRRLLVDAQALDARRSARRRLGWDGRHGRSF